MKQPVSKKFNATESLAEGNTVNKKPLEALREARRSRGLTQTQLSGEIGVDEKTVRRWEAGETRPYGFHINKLSNFFGMPPEQLGLATQEDIQPILEKELIPSAQESPQEKELVSSPSVPRRALTFRSWMPWVGIPLALFVIVGGVFISVSLRSSNGVGIPGGGPSNPVLSQPTPVQLSQGSKGCGIDSNTEGYLKVYTKQGLLCFSGTGALKLSISNVQKVEVGRYPSQWTYFTIDNKQHTTPQSGRPDLYWCGSGAVRDYSKGHPILLLEISIAPSKAGIQCAYNEALMSHI